MPDGGIVSTSHLHHQHSSHSVVDASSYHINNNISGNNNSNINSQQQHLVVNRSLASLAISNNNNNNPNESNDQNNNNNANNTDGDLHARQRFFETNNIGQYPHGGHLHWSHLLRQVVLTTPSVEHLDNRNNPKQEEGSTNSPLSSHTVIPLQISGGSENGQFAFIGQVNKNEIRAWTSVGDIDTGDVILEIQKQQVAGYTQADIGALLYHCLRVNSVTLTVAPQGSLGPELRSYLNTRFQKGSVDHSLQGVIRDNLYLRTVPVTTRPPRPGEIPGVDYTFLSVDEFMELERNGSLLESGVYAGNHYGTPKPWASRPKSVNSQLGNSSSVSGDAVGVQSGDQSGAVLPGMHPSSEGKRRRNRSNVEALGAGGGGDDEPLPSPNPNINRSSTSTSAYPSSVVYNSVPPPDDLGPLPNNWEMQYTEKGEVYFIDHNNGTSHWLDPRLSRIQKLSLEECAEDELPFGWERIEDPHYGTYYIDHVNRRTQFENPVIQAKKSKSPINQEHNETTNNSDNFNRPSLPNSNPPSTVPQIITTNNNSPLTNHNRLSVPRGKTPVEFMSNPQQRQYHHHHQENNNNPNNHSNSNITNSIINSYENHSSMPNSMNSTGLRVKSIERDRPSIRFFTRDPSQLVGENITTTLIKSPRGLGFTIVGGDDDDGLDEFLQIKSVVHDGAAWRDGKLRTGDVLVRVSGRCVLGYTHQEMVSIFQSIAPGEEVELQVCRGYPLPFDPADPNTEIVTTVAVAPVTDDADKRSLHRPIDWTGRPSTPDSLAAHSAHSLPELSTNDRADSYGRSNATNRPASVDLLSLDAPSHGRPVDNKVMPKYPMETAIFLTVNIIKGNSGFGFTIADSVAGQKVKKVLDPTHCGGLQEGDKLIAIDAIDLRGLGHSQVVQVLKEFPLGREATLTIQRIQAAYNHHHNKLVGVPSNHYSDTRLIPNRPGIMPRSKTPTADLGRGSRMRDSLPERPKTPLFLDSSSQMNGQLGLYNGDIHQQPSESHSISHMHKFVPSERYSTSSMGMNSAMQNFTDNDLNNQIQVPIRDWIEMTIDLQRRAEGFGFRIVGGTEEGSQVSVGHIVPRGAAALDGRLQTNDQIIAVDGHSVIGASHRSVVELMAQSANTGRVRLLVRKPMYGTSHTLNQAEIVGSPARSPSISMPLHVTLRRQPIEGFGFVIISSASKSGATIGRIVEGSPADRCGQLHVGDRILAVNQIDISSLHHSQVVQLIKDSGLVLTLSVITVGNSNLSQPSQLSPSEQQSNMIASDSENFTLKENHQGYDIGTAFISPDNHPMHFSSNNSGSSHQDSLEQVFAVHLTRGNRGFGFSIRGGKEFQNMPLFVLRLAEDGPAANDGRMMVGDQILQINGISTHDMTHSQAIHIIKNGGLNVHLLLRRGSVPPFPESFLNQNFAGARFEDEGQSLSSNDPQFQIPNSPMYREQHHPQS